MARSACDGVCTEQCVHSAPVDPRVRGEGDPHIGRTTDTEGCVVCQQLMTAYTLLEARSEFVEWSISMKCHSLFLSVRSIHREFLADYTCRTWPDSSKCLALGPAEPQKPF